MKWMRSKLGAVAASLLLLSPVMAQDEHPTAPTTPAEEAREAFAWLESLGYPDVTGKPLVSVARALDGDAMGFLVEDHGERWTVLTLPLDLWEIDPKTREHDRDAQKYPVDLAEYARARLDTLREAHDDLDHTSRRFDEAIAEPAELVVLAWGCARNGEEALAQELWDAAAALPVDRAGPATLRARLAEQVAQATMWRNVLAFGDPSVPRTELLARFRAFVERFEGTEHHARAVETAATLEGMVAEDAAHQAPPADATLDQRVAHLIFSLRDQNGQQWSQPGACDVFADPRGESSPAHQLLALGFDAVPQLIEALEDPRFTRSVGFHRNFYFSHHVLRVGDCAQVILEQIAGVDFYQRTYTNGAMVKDGDAAGVKAAAQRWWAAVQARGIEQVMVDAVARGDLESPEQARRLLARAPGLALDAISRGVEAAAHSYARAALVDVVSEHPEGEALLLRYLEHDDPQVRVTAASSLHRRGRPEGLPVLLEVWAKASLEPEPDELWQRVPPAASSALSVLLAAGRPEAIDAIAARYDELPLDTRLDLVQSLAGRAFSRVGAPAEQEGSAELDVRVEALLVRALGDTEVRVGIGGIWGDVSYSDPRVCDMAAHVLSRRWPHRYAFDLGAPRAARERGRLACLNAWRTGHGMDPLPPPASPTITAAPAEQTGPPLDALVAAYDPAARATLEGLGLPALPAVRERLGALPADHPARERLGALARELSCVVRAVLDDPTQAPVEPALRERVARLEGTRLGADDLVEVLCDLVREASPGDGVSLLVERDASRGVVVTVSGMPGAREDILGVDSYQRVRAGRHGLLSLDGVGARAHYATPAAYDQLRRALGEALAEPADVPVEASVTLQLR